MKKSLEEVLHKGIQFKKFHTEDALKFIMLMMEIVGVSNKPSKESTYVIVDAVLRYFGTMTDKEIRQAFEWAASGRIEVTDHYNNFSFKYFSNVINSWKSKVNSIMNDEIKSAPAIEEKYEGEVDWSEVVEMIRTMPIGRYWHNIVVPLDIYDWLIRTGKINPSGEEKKEAMELIRNKMMHELHGLYISSANKGDEHRILTAIRNDYKGKGSEGYEIVVRETKKKFIIDYIKSLK